MTVICCDQCGKEMDIQILDIWQKKGILAQINEVCNDDRMTVTEKLNDIKILVKTLETLEKNV